MNTLGAVAGAGLANFVLIESFGNRGMLWSACLVNATLAFAAFQYSRFLSRASDTSSDIRKPESDITNPEDVASPNTFEDQIASTENDSDKGHAGVVYAASGIVGFAFFLMEIVWYRMLGPLLGGTTYTFGLILCIALLGIGLGGAIYNISGRWFKPTIGLLSLTCGLEALLIAIPFWCGDSIAIWALRQQMETVSTFGDQVWNWFHIGAFVILPAALVAGFQFPLLIAIAGTGRTDIGKHVGWTFAANTVGAICGSMAGGFLLLPMLSAPGLWRLVVVMLVALGGVTAIFAYQRKFLPVATWAVLGSLAVMAILAEGPSPAWRHSGIGAGRAQTIDAGKNAEQGFINLRRRRCVWEAEGVETSVAAMVNDSLSFVVNGKSDGNAYEDAGTQVGLGLVGPLLHPTPENGLVIGLGTGESAGWLAACRDIQTVDVIELEPAIEEIAMRCSEMNRNALENPKVQVHYNDAREYLLTSGKNYDLIISEPSNPYRAGIANLYTQEFYQAVSERLENDGLFVQWLQGYEVDDRTVMIVLNTLRSTFPNLQVWRTRARDMLLVCGKSELALAYDADSLRERLVSSRTIGDGLRLAWRVDDLEGILAHYVCGRRTIDDWLGEQSLSINSDDRNLLEYAFAKTLGKSTRFSCQDLFVRSRENQDALPFTSPSIDSNKVENRRLAMNLYLGETVPDDAGMSSQTRIKAQGYTFYLAQRYKNAVQFLSEVEIDPACPIDRLVYAHSLAMTGASIPSELMDAIRKDNVTEAFALDAIGHVRAGQIKPGIDATLAAFKRLRRDPWGSAPLLDSVFRMSASLAAADRNGAVQIFECLEAPFAALRMEETRILTRYVVSENVGKQQMIDALSAFEPNVPWKGWLLEQRSQLYSDTKHPLRSQALSDLQRFQSWDR